VQPEWRRTGTEDSQEREKLERVNHSRLARESAKLDPKFEQAMAEEGMSGELAEWPEY